MTALETLFDFLNDIERRLFFHPITTIVIHLHADTVKANYVQFWFHRFRSGIFDVKVALHTGRSVIEIVDKITELIKIGRHGSSRSIAQELKIDHKTVLSHLSKVGFKKTLDGQTVKSDLYWQQLDRLKLATDKKRPELANRRGVVFHQDNGRPHTFVVICQKL
ncbi:histone-lysine N-methyltransferase SETMAR [Trichonephila clavipes]|nr:histone-lysine N-methyltransferase SETMAR [Trichonephila clavipes]